MEAPTASASGQTWRTDAPTGAPSPVPAYRRPAVRVSPGRSDAGRAPAAGHAVKLDRPAAVTGERPRPGHGERRHHRRGSTSAPRPRRSCREDFARHRKRPRAAPGARRARPCQPLPVRSMDAPTASASGQTWRTDAPTGAPSPVPACRRPAVRFSPGRSNAGRAPAAGHAVKLDRPATITGERPRPGHGERRHHRRGSTSAPRPRRSCREDRARYRKRPRAAPEARRARPCPRARPLDGRAHGARMDGMRGHESTSRDRRPGTVEAP